MGHDLSVSDLACRSRQELVNCKIFFVEMTSPGGVLLVFEERVGFFQVTVMDQVEEHVAPRVDPCVTIRSHTVVWRCII
jgi:hypothetical protein